jgi:hypothetical protein
VLFRANPAHNEAHYSQREILTDKQFARRWEFVLDVSAKRRKVAAVSEAAGVLFSLFGGELARLEKSGNH